MEIREAIEHAINGRAILFTGAGFSHKAMNLKNEKPPDGIGLAKILIKLAGFEYNHTPLERASTIYIKQKSADELIKLLNEAYTIKSVDDCHKSIAMLPWKRCYTTNYDNTFELARKLSGGSCKAIIATDPPEKYASNSNMLLHINGSIERLSKLSLNTDFKLTSTSYSSDSFEQSGWAFDFRNEVRLASAIIFIGYSMADLDIRRILYSENVSNKSIFIVAPEAVGDTLEVFELGEIGSVFPIGIEEFGNFVEEAKTTYIPVQNEMLLSSWERVEPLQPSTPPNDQNVIEWLTEGKLANSILTQSIGPNANEYIIPRNSILQSIKIHESTSYITIISGQLGSGKTFLSNCFSQMQLAKGWQVFKIGKSNTHDIGEAQQIIQLPGKKLLVIESYHNHKSLIRFLHNFNADGTMVIATERSEIHEFSQDYLMEIYARNIAEVDLTKLIPNEARAAVSLFDRYGLWNTRASWSPDKKFKFMYETCSGELSFILLDVLKSTHVINKYRELITETEDNQDIVSIMICLFSLEVIGIIPETYIIQELLGGTAKNWTAIKSNSSLKSIIDFTSHGIHARSSILGKYLLKNIFSADIVVKTLISMAKIADSLIRNREYKRILKNLMRYKNIETLMPDRQKRSAIINYYEGIKNLNGAKNHPLFWLQYGIACLTMEELDRAEFYFKTAYSIAGTLDHYKTHQIDNHYSRLLLEKARASKILADVIILVDEAKSIILMQMERENRHYPFRVSIGFFKVYRIWKTHLSVDQDNKFISLFTEIERRCRKAELLMPDNPYIQDCLRELEAIK
jgi:hypothetical protein